MPATPRILFVCVENACRSQMAEAIARDLLGDRAEVYSAGSRPAARVNPLAVAVLQEQGLRVASPTPKGFEALPPGRFDYVVGLGCGEACPHIPAAHRLDWRIPDPQGRPIDVFRQTRETIATAVRGLVDDLQRQPGTAPAAGPAS